MPQNRRPMLRAHTSSAHVEAKALAIGTELGRLGPALKRRAARLARVAAARRDAAPPPRARLASIEGVRGGTLTLAVDSAGCKFRVDRALREGLESKLRERVPSIRSIRVRIATPEMPAPRVRRIDA
ncbi:MAG: DciA family protein [Phycisphaerales bacterium]